MDNKELIKILIGINKNATNNIISLENSIQDIKIKTDKDKANFGNMCVMLRAFRTISDTSEAMLINENVLIDDMGDFYQKIENDNGDEREP